MKLQLLTLTSILTLGGISLADTALVKTPASKSSQSVAESLSGHTRLLKDGALSTVNITKNPDYYFVYYAASW